MNLGGKIKELRGERKMSMRGLARAVDVTPMHISNIEKGFCPLIVATPSIKILLEVPIKVQVPPKIAK